MKAKLLNADSEAITLVVQRYDTCRYTRPLLHVQYQFSSYHEHNNDLLQYYTVIAMYFREISHLITSMLEHMIQ